MQKGKEKVKHTFNLDKVVTPFFLQRKTSLNAKVRRVLKTFLLFNFSNFKHLLMVSCR
jgi:hypothetical protein